jgi:hypothetical protein
VPPLERDPVSVMLDGRARVLLSRAYADRGQWVFGRLADPTPAERAEASGRGIDVTGPDAPSVRSARGGLNARSRWGRGLVRALYYQHRNYSTAGTAELRTARRTSPRSAGALRVQIGRRLPAAGVFPAGRAVRVQLASGGRAKTAAVDRLPDSGRIYEDDGTAGGRHAEVSLRDW